MGGSPSWATSSGARRSKQALFRFLLLLGSVVFSLLVMELALRAAGFSYRLYPERIEFGYPSPTDIGVLFDPDPDLLWVPKRPQPYSRILARAQRREPALIFLGCSCTQLGRYPLFFSRMIEQAHPGRTLRWANFAVSGWSSFQGLQQLKRDVLSLRPRVVTIYYGWNDHWIGFGIEDKDVRKVNRAWSVVLQKLRLVQLLTKAYVHAAAQTRGQYPNRVSPDDYRENLRSMISLARENDIIPVLLTAPSSHETLDGLDSVSHLTERWLRSMDELIPLHRQYVAITREVAESEGVVLCDLYDEFKALAPDHDVTECFGEDGIHFSEFGSEVAARFLFETFEEHDLVERILVPSGSVPGSNEH